MKYFWVNQNKTYDIEFENDFLWAPIKDKGGHKPHHWENMLDVSSGDVIFHYCKGAICAISIAEGECFNCNLPSEMHDFSGDWEKEGRKLNSKYHALNRPLIINDVHRQEALK